MFKQKSNIKNIELIELFSDLPNIDHEPSFLCKVIANNKITSDAYILSILRPENFNFIPGQYVWVVLPELSKKQGVIDRRAYSIYSGSDDSKLEFLISESDSSYVSKLKTLKAGDEVMIIGPMGSSFVMPPHGVIMIGGGVGISPFVSILRSKIKGDITLVAYNSKGNLLSDNKEFDELTQKYNYKFIFKESRARSVDFKGILHQNDNKHILISGSQGFVNHVTNIILALGIRPDRIIYEQNYPQLKVYKKFDKLLADLPKSYHSHDIRLLSELGDLFFQISKQTSNHVILTDSNGRILFANQAATDMTGYSFDEMVGQTPRLWGGLMPNHYYKKIWDYLKNGVSVKHTIMNRRRNGELYIAIATITPILRKNKVIMFVSTEEDVTALRNVDKAKTEFVSFASHQLRAPLSTVGWYTEMLLDGDAGKLLKEQKKYLEEIRAANQRMVELVGSLLNVSRLEVGTFLIELVPTNMVKVIREAINEQKNEISKKKINFSFTSTKDIPEINGDPKLLHMIVQNLLSNSIKYTPDKGKVIMSLSLYNSRNLLLKISDNGYGIPEKQQDKIFTKLFRADNAVKISSEGTGLGLYIIRSILEKVDGKIWFESEENKGATFYVRIPIKAVIRKNNIQ